MLENQPKDQKAALLIWPGDAVALSDAIQALVDNKMNVNVLAWDKTYTGGTSVPNYTHENIVLGWTKVPFVRNVAFMSSFTGRLKYLP